MRRKTIIAAGSIALFLLCSMLSAPNGWAQDKLAPAEAKKIAKEAYIFNYPLVMMYRTMYLQAIDTKSKSYSGGFGKWLHLGTSSPKNTDIVTPNNDWNFKKRDITDGSYKNECAIFFQPVMPIPLTESWKLITLPVVPVELYRGRPVDNKKGVIL
jgi:hypothetical protein